MQTEKTEFNYTFLSALWGIIVLIELLALIIYLIVAEFISYTALAWDVILPYLCIIGLSFLFYTALKAEQTSLIRKETNIGEDTESENNIHESRT